MQQRYIRTLVDLSVNVMTYQHSISGAVARDELNNPVPSDCAKKCQQPFLALLPETSLTTSFLVIALRKVNNLEKKTREVKDVCSGSVRKEQSGRQAW